jgi:hypothetical protein
MERLNFCKSHFISQQLHYNWAEGPVGAKLYLHDTADLADSITLLANHHNPFYIDMWAVNLQVGLLLLCPGGQ